MGIRHQRDGEIIMNTLDQMFPNLGGTNTRSVSTLHTFKAPYGQSTQSDLTFSVDSLETDLFSFMDELNERGVMFDTYVMLDVPHIVFTFMCDRERQLASHLVHKFKLK